MFAQQAKVHDAADGDDGRVSLGVCQSDVQDLEDVSTSSEGEREQVDDEYALGQSTTMRFFGAEKKKR